tara:strand:- start:1459 stop:2562 length:1104 start_codon:yes stop_codon:yes gene_type:complete
MANLTGLQISDTFDGLLNTASAAAFNNSYQTITDGLGNNSGLQILNNGAGNYGTILTSDGSFTNGLAVDNSGINFGGTINFQTSSVDFTNATVIGLPANSDTTYTLSAVENNPDGIIRLSGSDASTNDVELIAGSNVNLGTLGNQITINSIDTNDNTLYDFFAATSGSDVALTLAGSDASTDTVTLIAGTNITLTELGGNVTIDAAGGGGTSKSFVFTTGTKDVWAGPAGQDVIVSQVLIPANTITGAATIEFRCPVLDGSEGQFNYTSFQIAPTPGDQNYISQIGKQSQSGGGDPDFWYRSINIATNGTAYYKDTNGYHWPAGGGDPIQEKLMDWALPQYFTVTAWCDATNAKFTAYSPSLTITNS